MIRVWNDKREKGKGKKERREGGMKEGIGLKERRGKNGMVERKVKEEMG